MARSLGAARSLLFVPGNRPDRFEKALAAGADVVVLDLEDAVAPPEKPAAREHIARFLRGNGKPCVVRVNATTTAWHRDDVAMAADRGAAVMLPKAENAADVCAVAGQVEVIALVETALGVLNSFAIASAPGVSRLAFGSLDFAAELGINADDHHALYAARTQLVLASGAAHLPPPVDGVTSAVHDEVRLRADLANAHRLGFGGKLCIHPAQVDAVNAGFAPSQDEVEWATEVIAAVRAAGDTGVIVLNGRMVDAPVIRRAERILASRDPHNA